MQATNTVGRLVALPTHPPLLLLLPAQRWVGYPTAAAADKHVIFLNESYHSIRSYMRYFICMERQGGHRRGGGKGGEGTYNEQEERN